MAITAFIPEKKFLNTHQVPVVMNITLKHFPIQSVTELCDIVGTTISTSSSDETGIIKISGHLRPTNGVNIPGCNYVLMLSNRYVKSSPIYLGVDDNELEEVGALVQSVIHGNSMVVVETDIAVVDEGDTTIATNRRTFTAASQDVVAYFFKFDGLRNEFIELLQAAQN